MTTRSIHAGRYGRFGGRYVAEALWTPLQQVADAFETAVADEAFLADYERWLDHRLGRPTPVTYLERLTDTIGGGQLWLKREDLCEGGSFTRNAAVAFGLMARRMGRRELVGETATGDYGLALGAVGNALGLKVRIFMGREDQDDEPIAVRRMRQLGVELETVDASLRGRKAACNEALRYWATHSESSFYAPSTLAAPDPYPRMLAYFLSVVGAEASVQLKRRGVRPQYVIAPVGSGGFAAGLFTEFIDVEPVHLVGVQAAGEGLSGRHAASLLTGRPGVFLGTHSFFLQDADGQILSPSSVAAGLSVAGVGPQHAQWAEEGRVQYVSVTDAEALDALRRLIDAEGLMLSLETAHAVAYALKLLPTLGSDEAVVVGVSGDAAADATRYLDEAEDGERP